MKSPIVLAVAALSLIAVSGCSTMQSKDQKVAVRGADIDDSAYVERIERIDRNRGIDLHWVNPPTKHVTGGE